MPLGVKPIGPRCVYKKNYSPSRKIEYTACIIITDNNHTDCGETYDAAGNVSTSWFPISIVEKHASNIDHFDVITACLNSKVTNCDHYVTLNERCPERLHEPLIIVDLPKALYGFQHSPPLWHNDIKTLLLSHEFAQLPTFPNLFV
jgi:hypothetical protein